MKIEVNNFSFGIIGAYILTFISIFIVRYYKPWIGNALALLTSFLTFLIAAKRPEHFPDVDTYFEIFQASATGDFTNPLYWSAHGEPGFKIISYLLYFLGLDYNDFLLFFSMLSLILLIIISKSSKINFAYIWYTYISFYFITRDLGIIRVAIASHLIVLALINLNKLRQLINIGVATFVFQYFSLIIYTAIILSRYKFNLINVLSIMIISILFGQFINFDNINNYIPDKQLQAYAETNLIDSGGKSILLPIFRNITYALLLYICLRTEIESRKIRIWLWSAVLSVTAYIMFAGILIGAQRFAAYFGAILPLAFAYYINKKNIDEIKFILITLICMINFISLFYFNDFVWKPY